MPIRDVFAKLYPNEKNTDTCFCPYRVCPLGAHSDHQHGLVSGFAINAGVYIMYAPTEDGSVMLHSMNLKGDHFFNVADVPINQNDWADYLRGAVVSLKRNYEVRRGLKAVIRGTLPIGGLSSSAALVISFLSALCTVNDITLSEKEMIQTAIWAENEYVGVKCGKLDQSCEVYSKKDHLLFLDTKDDKYELIPANPKMKPYEIAVFFSGVERTLVGSAFNKRVDELKATAYALKALSGMEYGTIEDSYLRDIPREIFERYENNLPENWRKRAVHFYTEFDRVNKGINAWREGDIETFGKLSFESGYSSIYNYETGSPELKKLYEIMCKTDGIYGGRFSGAGFKGCCMAIIDPSFKEDITKKVTREYLSEFPDLTDKFSVHFCVSADGCKF